MAAIDLGQLFGGKQFLSNVSVATSGIPASSSGTLLTLTATGGNRVRLDSLTANSAPESNIRITVDGNDIYTGDITTFSSGGTIVSQTAGIETNAGNLRNVISDVVGYEIVITKTTGSTANVINYQWSEGS